MFRFQRSVFSVWVSVALLTLAASVRLSSAIAFAGAPALRFCIYKNAMPRAGKDGSGQPHGVDVAVAQLLAAKLNRPCDFHWCKSDACRLRNLKQGHCDVVLGVPHESVTSPDVAWTKPYAAGKFGLLVASENTSIRALPDVHGKRVGLVAGTVPLSARNHTLVRFPSREVLVRGFRQAQLDGALVDTDFANWYLDKHPELALRLVDKFESPYRWAIGIAVRANDASLQKKLSRAIDDCIQNGRFTTLYAEQGLAYRPPPDRALPKVVSPSGNTWQRVLEQGVLVVSMDPANLPYSSADEDRLGFDVEIAEALARELGVQLQLEWIDVHRETAIGQLFEGECDLAFGVAIDPNAMDDEEGLAGKVIYSRPYYGTGYLLVAREQAKAVTSLCELKGDRSRRLGTQAGTIADYALRQRGYQRRLFGTQLGVLHALENATIDYAYMWSNIAWMLHNAPETGATPVDGYIPEDRWNIAIAMRYGNDQLKLHVDRALQQIMASGLVARAMRRYQMPYFAPFEVAHEGSSQSDIAQSPVDRGLEPDMRRRQHSRQKYGGLERIRSRGTLVVGLDQNNLPFSTAHPQPTGIDYELAELLAEKLGVALEIYWAYSSHDSYPSKLATKRLCDVMLGVMPDDRFARRVDYSEPYYHTQYVYAVSADSDAVGDKVDLHSAPANQTIAIEPGIAIRGLDHRNARTYTNVEAILSAVANGEVRAGYVISSRAHWLVAQKWRGKIRFSDLPSAVDRFPICAAVRRDEVDLKGAIDTTWNELRKSGQLAQVFARWHVPFDKVTP